MQKIGILVLAASVAGCATIVRGTSQSVSIDTPGHPGASCTLQSPGVGSRVVTTPASIELEKSKHNVQVTCRKDCFYGAGLIASYTEGMAAGNVLFGGVLGLGVDAATGAMNKYADQTQIPMQTDPSCGPAPGPRRPR